MTMPAPVLLAHDDLGAGRPVLLIHGFPLSRRLWAPQQAELSARWRVIAPDLRGHGASPAPGGTYTMAHHAADIIALLERAQTGPVALVGLSIGGYIAFELLRRRPDWVGALVLACTRAEADDPAGRERRRTLAQLASKRGLGSFAEVFLPGLLSQASMQERPDLAAQVRPDLAAQVRDDLVAQVREMILGASVAGVVGSLLGMAERPDSTALLRGIRVPTLIVAGRDDRAIPPAAAETLHRSIPGARLVTLAGGHLPNLESPAEFNRELVHFLHEHWN